MAQYYFHVRNGDQVSRDPEGQELPDLEAARREAVNANREMLSEVLLHGGSRIACQIDIADGDGEVLATILADDVLLKDGSLRAFDDDIMQSAPGSWP